MRWKHIISGILSLVFVTALENHVFSASFDCTKASTPIELLICTDSQLFDVDSQLGHSYRTAREDTSKTAIETIRKEQRQWIRQRDILCPVKKKDLSCEELRAGHVQCLMPLYHNELVN